MSSLDSPARPVRAFLVDVPTERLAATALFVVTFLYTWISLSPFPDLTFADREAAAAAASNVVNRIVVVALIATLVGYALAGRARGVIVRPRIVVFLLFAWLVIVSMPSPDPGFALRRLLMAFLICTAAGIVLTLPKDERHFAQMIALCCGVVLALCWFGALLFPRYAIHQFTDELEPMLEGDWRGLFAHKNTAGAAMVIILFFGLYVTRALNLIAGLAIIAAAGLFLLLTGSKTSIGLFPLSLLVAFLVVRVPYVRLLTLVGTLAAVSFFTIGSAVSERIAGLVASVGIDATFTRRTEIWQIALEHIEKRPWTGYGYQSFWRSADLMYGHREELNWAVNAADGHNGYLDLLLTAGIPGFALALVFLLVLPAFYVGRAEKHGAERRLTELFTRIWVFGMLVACLESTLLATTGALWFSMLMAIFGLRLQARARLRSGA